MNYKCKQNLCFQVALISVQKEPGKEMLGLGHWLLVLILSGMS
jgi:hypothetical protein